ncbi:hypothetical protein [Paenibacillus planticolens]|uniref:Uncharacterized protein n=1 Tax=Paenibacillus planticolens TaxID=2654976 RepID=A0ABX1ZYH9_9BACL|nr:hypothetical protein [Paenibacillus planticolens]NOV03843.1 hypothetical protein [Paenibacillus planticolens]
METLLDSFLQELMDKYKALNIPHKFSLLEADRILKEKYLAVELDKKEFEDLKGDIHVCYENISKCYTIHNEEVLNRLYSAKEKISHFIMIEFLKKQTFHHEDMEKDKAEMWLEMQQGKRINVILESENEYITSFTLQGGSDKLLNELIVFKGIDADKCSLDNQEYLYYLQALTQAGYL